MRIMFSLSYDFVSFKLCDTFQQCPALLFAFQNTRFQISNLFRLLMKETQG